jgi:hypothetical protein
MSYERALAAARLAPMTPPEFDTVAAAASRDRLALATERRDSSARARRWMLVAALTWLLLPLDALITTLFGTPARTAGALAFDVAVLALPPTLVSSWGARLVRDQQRFRSAILGRAVAVSNLVVALLYAISVGGMFGAVFSSLLALASARVLQLLGDHGLDGAGDPSSEFRPVRFRGILSAALVMAFADALTLLFSCSVAGVRVLAFVSTGLAAGPLATAWVTTLAAAALMAANVWGLLRLRTWALFSNLASNVAVAALALQGMLATNPTVSAALAVTAAAQLLLVVPVLAAALGDSAAGHAHARLAVLTRWIVPALVVATVVMAALHFGPALPNTWINPSLRP